MIKYGTENNDDNIYTDTSANYAIIFIYKFCRILCTIHIYVQCINMYIVQHYMYIVHCTTLYMYQEYNNKQYKILAIKTITNWTFD